MIEARNLTKRYGAKLAVDDVGFALQPGIVTGFLGPNGAGKSTTMRMVMGLDRPTSGSVTVLGRPYAEHRNPLNVAGALLDAKGVHPGRTARSHLRALAATHGLPASRVDRVLELTGLESVANKRVGGFSLGMGQRLGIAAALLGDPQVLVLDEPVNGLDPDGVLWVRRFVRAFAAEGRTVLVSSHVLSEVQHTVDDVVIIARGRLVHASSLAELSALAAPQTYVESPAADTLARLCGDRGWTARPDGAGLVVADVPAAEIGAAAYAGGIELHQLASRGVGLEDVFLQLTEGGAR